MEALLSHVLEYGLGGLAVAILSTVIVFMDKEIKRLNETRVTDAKAMSEVISTLTVAMRDLTATSEARTRAQEAMARNQEQSTHAQASLVEEIKRLQSEVNRLLDRRRG